MKKFITTVHTSENEQIMYAYTATREGGLLEALAYIASFGDTVPGLKDTLTIRQEPNTPKA